MRNLIAGQQCEHVDHRVAELHGETWTLLIAGPKTSSWGFWVPGTGHVPWRELLASNGMEAEY